MSNPDPEFDDRQKPEAHVVSPSGETPARPASATPAAPEVGTVPAASTSGGDPAPSAPAEPAEPPVADGVWYSLSRNYIKTMRIGSIAGLLMAFAPMMFVPVIVWLVRGDSWLLSFPFGFAALFVFLLWFTWVYASLHHKHAGYRVDERQIEWRHGVWWRKVTIVPRTRVQHTDVSQGPLERRFGLGTLHVYTAGTENAKVSISGLEHDKAARIRDHLVETGTGDAV